MSETVFMPIISGASELTSSGAIRTLLQVGNNHAGQILDALFASPVTQGTIDALIDYVDDNPVGDLYHHLLDLDAQQGAWVTVGPTYTQVIIN